MTRAVLVGLRRREETAAAVQERMDEMIGLADSAGVDVVETFVQAAPHPDPRTYVGRGKLEDVASAARTLEIPVVLFDRELTPSQTRNLERLLRLAVIDRSRLILDIFAQRARTREGKLQVELAQLIYLLPRLTGRGVELSRLGGGIGTRGPGETRLEVDRRRIRARIRELKAELAAVERSRDVQREGRARHGIPVVALVGYTNAGKSTLLQALSDTEVHAADRAFDTLDPLVRAVTLEGGYRVLCSDTVGFIRELPEPLIDAFAATLEELRYADLLLHVADASHPRAEGQLRDVERLLVRLGLREKPRLIVWNKVDLAPVVPPTGLAVSARYGWGLDELRRAIRAALYDEVAVTVQLTYDQGSWLHRLHSVGQVEDQIYLPEGYRVRARLPRHEADRLAAVASVVMEGALEEGEGPRHA